MEYEKDYSEKSFFDKVANYAKTAGATVIYLALLLYYAALNPKVPLKIRAVAVGALGYFISPLDAIPDIVPAVGYSDDLGALLLAISVCLAFIDEQVKENAKAKMISFFGEDTINEINDIEKKYLKR